MRALTSVIAPKPAEVKANTQAALLLKIIDAGVKVKATVGTLHPSKGVGKGPDLAAKLENQADGNGLKRQRPSANAAKIEPEAKEKTPRAT